MVDLSCRRFKSALEDLRPGFFVAFTLGFFLRHGVDTPQQRQAAAGNNSLSNGSLGCADRVVECLLLRFHLRFGRSADTDDGDSAGKFCQSLLQLFFVVIAGRFLDLAADLFNATVDLVGDHRHRR